MLACGTPVITYDRTAVPEVVDTSCGLAVPCDPRNIRSALDALHVSPEACVARAQQFDKNQRFSEYLHLYEQLYTSDRS